MSEKQRKIGIKLKRKYNLYCNPKGFKRIKLNNGNGLPSLLNIINDINDNNVRIHKNYGWKTIEIRKMNYISGEMQVIYRLNQ